MHICLCPGLWPWSGSGAKHKVNEVENMLESSGCQARGNGVPACHSPPQKRAEVEGSGDSVRVKENSLSHQTA